jgi:ABC-type branched-subunit amino acid transport system substrate-binding protein
MGIIYMVKNILCFILFLLFIFDHQIFAQSGKDKTAKNELKIGVLVPLEVGEAYKEQESIGQDVLDAINYLNDEFNKTSPVKIRLIITNTRMDTNTVIKSINDLSADPAVIAILGPLFSDEFTSAGRIANEKKITIISPTSTGNGLASKSEYTFQANPDFITRAKVMGEYAVKRLKYKNLAVFSPNNSYGKVTAENFVKIATKNGANILGLEYYNNSNTFEVQKSMGSLCKKIFEKGMETYISLTDDTWKENSQKLIKHGISRKKLDSLEKSVKEESIYNLLGKNAPNIAKTLNLNTFNKTKYEVDLPVNSADAVYVPITSKGDIKLIYAALASYKINAILLGTGDYNHILELESTKEKMNGLIFDYDSYYDIKDNAYKNFYRNFVQKTKKQVSKYTLYGYDTYSILLAGIKRGHITRKDINSFISNIENFTTLHSKITLKKNHINSNLNILQFKNGKITKIDEYHTEE